MLANRQEETLCASWYAVERVGGFPCYSVREKCPHLELSAPQIIAGLESSRHVTAFLTGGWPHGNPEPASPFRVRVVKVSKSRKLTFSSSRGSEFIEPFHLVLCANLTGRLLLGPRTLLNLTYPPRAFLQPTTSFPFASRITSCCSFTLYQRH